MKPVLISAVLLGLLAVGFGEDCDVKKYDGFLECIGKKVEEELSKWTPEKIKDKEDEIDKCFVSNGCEKPDYDRDVFSDLPPNFQILARKMKKDWENTPQDVKKCLFSDMKTEIKNKLNECLTKQNVPVVTDIPEGLVKHLTEMLSGGADDKQKKFFEMVFTSKTNVARALRLCHETKDDAVKNVFNCFQGVRQKHLFEKMCESKHACEKDKLDDTCVKRGDEINDACCKCNEEHRDEFLKKLDEMRKSSKADMDSVAEAFTQGHNVTEMIAKAKQCFEDNKADIPASFKLLEAMHNVKEAEAGPKLTFNKATIDTIQDVVMGMMDEEKCYVCKGGASGSASNSTMF